MTDFNPFSAAPEEVPVAAPAPEEQSGGNAKLLIGLGAVATVAVGAGAFLLLSGGGVDEDFGVVAAAPRAAVPAAAPTASPQPKLPAQSNLRLGRNPFRPLYVEPVAAPAGDTTTPTDVTSGGTTPVVVVPVTDGGTGAPAPAPVTAAPAPAPAPAPAAQSTVRLLSVETGKGGANPIALFDYDGAEVTGGEGDVMAGKLLVLSLQKDHTGSWFANLQLGDGTPFEVHERQTVVVQ
jgi:hypothetical protein